MVIFVHLEGGKDGGEGPCVFKVSARQILVHIFQGLHRCESLSGADDHSRETERANRGQLKEHSRNYLTIVVHSMKTVLYIF